MKNVESVYSEKKECCGCTACKNICPKSAIFMESDIEGFLYPKIDKNICINCGLCIKICKFSKRQVHNKNISVTTAYAVKHKNNNVRLNSTSGGMFTAISDYILDNNGVIFGASFNENMEVIHSKVTNREGRDKLRGSKYVQSDLNNTFKDIKKLLENNILTMFIGTPCQVDGLKEYLNNINSNNLILCDIVCHGVPSPLIFNEYIKFIEKKFDNKVIDYKCRDKINGWHTHTETVIYNNGSKDSSSDIYKNLFYSHNILRPACHNCKYSNLNRVSDITIGDFWGIEKSMPEFDDNKGVSLVLVNSKKGEEYFEKIKNDIEYRISSIENCLQPQLIRPSEVSIERNRFWRDYNKYGLEYNIKKYGRNDLFSKIKRKIRKEIIKINKN